MAAEERSVEFFGDFGRVLKLAEPIPVCERRGRLSGKRNGRASTTAAALDLPLVAIRGSWMVVGETNRRRFGQGVTPCFPESWGGGGGDTGS